MATIVKASAFIAFVRLFYDSFLDIKADWQIFVAIIAAATLFIGNLTAVFQQSVKRMSLIRALRKLDLCFLHCSP